ncbi:hypothetical protein AB0I81_28885 [Nonomuraea sp. NPDC050404]|uniref:hypothetical protein n=1 Tax=Nonomuraea sp. NPDC050404 TaxID=3155783 RepID=UPI0034029629
MATSNTGVRARITRVLGVVLLSIAAIALSGAQPAAAAQSCTGQQQSNVCITTTDIGGGLYHVTLGIDFRIGRAAAQQIIDAPGEPFTGAVFEVDATLGYLFSMPVIGVGASDDAGLSADFQLVVPRIWLDEDAGSAVDTVRGRIRLLDSRVNRVITFHTPPLSQIF